MRPSATGVTGGVRLELDDPAVPPSGDIYFVKRRREGSTAAAEIAIPASIRTFVDYG